MHWGADVYNEGIQKLVTRYDKGLNVRGYCVEKYLCVCNNDTLNLFLFLLYFPLQPNGHTFWMILEQWGNYVCRVELMGQKAGMPYE